MPFTWNNLLKSSTDENLDEFMGGEGCAILPFVLKENDIPRKKADSNIFIMEKVGYYNVP